MLFQVSQPLSSAEKKVYTFEFDTLLGSDTISSQSCAASVYSGTDASPSDIISGSASTSGTVVSQLIDGTLAVVGVVYLVIATVTTLGGQTLQVATYITVYP